MRAARHKHITLCALAALGGCGEGSLPELGPGSAFDAAFDAPSASASPTALATSPPSAVVPNNGAKGPSVPPDWCGRVTIPPPTAARKQQLLDEAVRRNPGGRLPGSVLGPRVFDHFLHTTGLLPPPSGAQPPMDDAEVMAMARALVAKNIDLLGYEPVDLERATATSSWGAGSWRVRFRGNRARPGYEAFSSVSITLSVTVDVQSNGSMSLTSIGSPLPPFKMCLTAPLAPTAPAIGGAVVGYRHTMHDIGGRPHIGEPIEASQIDSIEPTIFVDRWSQAHTVTLNFAYAVRVGSLTLFVDASSATLIGVDSGIVT